MTPAGFPHSDIHGSKPACGSPWLYAAYHVFLRRPVPWHPPCALSNLIVTKLSSCQRIAMQSLIVFFLLRPTAKLSHFCAHTLFPEFRNWFLYKMFFHLAVQFSKYILRPSRFARWLPARIFQILCAFRFAFAHPPKIRFLSIPENDTGSRRRTVISTTLHFRFVDFSPLRLSALSCSTNSLACVCIDLE